MSLRHNQIRDLTADLLKIIYHDVLIKSTLQQLTGKSLHERTENITDEARVDIAAKGFWISGQRAFFCYKGIQISGPAVWKSRTY